MGKKIWVYHIIPGVIFFALWLDGWFFPLILLPLLYVLVVEKKSMEWLGFSRGKFDFSVIACFLIDLVLIGMYYPIFLYYLPEKLTWEPPSLYGFFFDVIWYPVYEEIAYRSFFLIHFADFENSCLSTRNLIANLSQSLLFLAIHKHHVGMPLVFIPLFFLGFLNGFLFQKTRNLYGCIASHAILNSFALFLRYLYR